MNKSIAETAGAADFGFGTAGEAASQMSSKLEEIRGQILEQAADFQGYRVSSESMFKVLGAMNEMNFTFKDMQKQIDAANNGINSFADVSIRAVAYGKLFGISSDQAAQNMAQMANEFGVGLQVISEGFHAVHKEALVSGFSTKRFYSTILEVTSGLGQYNVRLEEAAGLLSSMGAALGEARGEALFKSAVGDQSAFSGKSPVDVLKDVLVKGGPDVVKDIFADEAAAQAAKMFEGMDEAQREAFGKRFKLDTSSAQAFGEAFAKAAPDQKAVRDLLAELKVEGETAGFGAKASRLALAGTGDLDRMATSYGDLGGASRMRFLMRVPKMFGESFDDLATALEQGTIPELQALLDSQGMSVEQFKELAALQGRLDSEFKAMREEAKGVAVGGKIDRGKYGSFRVLGGGKFQKIDDQGNALSGAFSDVDSYLAAQNDFIEQQTDVVSEDMKLARQVARNTEDLNTVIQENVAAILNKIYATLMDIWHWISGDASKRKEMKSFRKTFEAGLAKAEKANEADLASARQALGSAKTAPEREAAEARVQEAEKKQAMLETVRATAPEVNPEDFANPAEYTDAVLRQAGVDPSILQVGASAPKSASMGRAKDVKSKGRIQEMLREASEYMFVGKPTKDDFSPMREILERELLSGMEGEQLKAYEDLIAYLEHNWVNQADDVPGNVPGTYFAGSANRWVLNQLGNALSGAFDWGEIQGSKATFANDMYVPANGRPVLLNSADQVLAMKPGGAIDRAGSRGGGGAVPVTIHVNGGDTRQVMQAVIKGIKIARGEPFA
jgi:hypothetical protein